MLEEIPVLSDLCLHVQHCEVQATAKSSEGAGAARRRQMAEPCQSEWEERPLSAEWVGGFTLCLVLFCLGKTVRFSLSLRLFGLMLSAILN